MPYCVIIRKPSKAHGTTDPKDPAYVYVYRHIYTYVFYRSIIAKCFRHRHRRRRFSLLLLLFFVLFVVVFESFVCRIARN